MDSSTNAQANNNNNNNNRRDFKKRKRKWKRKERNTKQNKKNDQIKSRMMNDEAPIHITEALVIAAIDENIHWDCAYFLLRREPDVLQKLLQSTPPAAGSSYNHDGDDDDDDDEGNDGSNDVLGCKNDELEQKTKESTIRYE